MRRMADRQRESGGVISPIIACAIPAVILMLYVAGYFGLCISHGLGGVKGEKEIRIYPASWVAAMYDPVAFIHGTIIGKTVSNGW